MALVVMAGCGMPEETVDTSRQLTDGWFVRAVAEVTGGGAEVSSPDYDTSGWVATEVPSTPMAALVANGRFPDLYLGTNLEEVDTEQFKELQVGTTGQFGGLGIEVGRNNGLTDVEAILAIENDDSDGDGFVNLTEITNIAGFSNTPTFPGLSAGNIGSTVNIPTGEVTPYLTPTGSSDTQTVTFAVPPRISGP